MAEPNILNDLWVRGTLTAGSFNLPSGSVTNDDIATLAAIDATKVVHRHSINAEVYTPATTVVALTAKSVYIAHAAGSLIAFKGFVTTASTGADRTLTVDLQKSTGAGAYATVLSTLVILSFGVAALTVVAGTISSAAYVAGDTFRLVVAVAGAAGAQAVGLHCTLITSENPA